MIWLCALMRHRPLRDPAWGFIDVVSGRVVLIWRCPCGREWMSDGGRWFGFKVERSS